MLFMATLTVSRVLFQYLYSTTLSNLNTDGGHEIKTVRFTVKCRPLVPLALRRREKGPFGLYTTHRLFDLGRRLFVKHHSINEFVMFKIAISPVKNRKLMPFHSI